MKKLLYLIIIIAFYSCNAQQPIQVNYPTYKTMLTQFFTSYIVDDLDSGYVKFEKKKEGWFVCVMGYDGNTDYYKKELYWDSKTQIYDSIDFSINKRKTLKESSVNKYMREYTSQKFAIHAYYNYPSWDWDVIGLLKDSENLSDTALYSLARAYSSYANGLISGQYGLADASKTFDLSYGENSLNQEQLIEYRKNQHLAIVNFNKLAQQNPMFETIVGSIDSKASNEYITAFYNLLIFQNEEEARKELKDGLYSDFLIATAKNYLMSCRKNAILFTNGDMDTYPLLYVQAQHNFRTDVKIINLSLLNIDRYIDFIQRSIMGSQGIKLSLEPTDYRGSSNNYLPIVSDPDITSLSLNELIMRIKSDDDAYRYPLSENEKVTFSPTKNFTLAINKAALTNSNTIELSEKENLPNSIKFKISKSYLIKSNIVLLDLLATNDWARPIYFASTTGKDSYLGMDNYFQLEGLTYCLTPLKTISNGYTIGGVNSSVLYDNLMTNFVWVNISSGNDYSNEGELHMGSNYRSSFTRLASKLIDENENDKAEIVLEKCISVLPFDVLIYDFHTLSIIESYYRLSKIEQAQELLMDFYNSQKVILDKHLSLTAEEQLDNRDHVRTNKYFVQALYQLTTKYEDKASEQKLKDDNYEKYLRRPE